jgi:iron complex transport system permease protein
VADVIAPPARRSAHPAALILALGVVAFGLSLHHLSVHLPADQWLKAIWAPDPTVLGQLLVGYAVVPRMLVSLLCGAALGLAGTLFQQVLRNPLAEPTTLGVSAGAFLALGATSIWAPALLDYGREWIALGGAVGATAIVFGLAWRKGLSPLALILAGLIVSLYAGAISTALILFNGGLRVLFIWGSGSLNLQGWPIVGSLALRFGLAAIMAALMLRPLTVAGLDDENARSLGLSLRMTRFLTLGTAVFLSASVVAAVGVIGFVGLAAPALVRLAGARRLRDRLVWAPLLGAVLLWNADQLVQVLATIREIPTGAATALIGAPLLLWLLPRLRQQGPGRAADTGGVTRRAIPWAAISAGGLLLAAGIVVSLSLGRGIHGWHWSDLDQIQAFLVWRLPRLAAAMAAGAMLAAAGTFMQRLTGNPMASPEVLGVSTGAAFGVIVLLLLAPGFGRPAQIGAAAAGAFVVLAAIMVVGRRATFSPERVLLVGIAIGTIFSALVSVLMASGDPRMIMLFSWISGSTYLVRPADATLVVGCAAVLFALTPLCRRWLEILPLGDTTAQAVGVPLIRARMALLLMAALFTATATMIVGPLSFIGLMAPHLVRMLGLQRPMAQLFGAALAGGILMVLADWLGRILLFPDQMPAGLIATLIGGPYLLWLMRHR